MTAADRHKTGNYPYRPTPPDLLKQLDEVHGAGQRSKVISDLLRRYLAGHAMPRPGEAGRDSDKTGQDRGA